MEAPTLPNAPGPFIRLYIYIYPPTHPCGGHQAAKHKLHPVSLSPACMFYSPCSIVYGLSAILDVGWCGQDHGKLPPNGHVILSLGPLRPRSLFCSIFKLIFCVFESKTRSPTRTQQLQTWVPKLCLDNCILQDRNFTCGFWNYGLSFPEHRRKNKMLSTNFTYPGFSWVIPASLKKHQTLIQTCTPKHNKIWQNAWSEKNIDLWHRFWFDFVIKHDPQMIPKSSKMAPLGPQGAIWGSYGPTRCLKTNFGPNLASQMTPKWTKMIPTWAKMAPT